MRVLLAIVVIVAQVAGPWLCCCGSVRLFAAAVPPVPVVAVASHAQVSDVCPHCAKSTPKPADQPTEPAAPARCPCGGVTIEAVPPAFADRDVAAVADLPAVPEPFGLAPVVVVPALPANDPPGTSPLPFLPTAVRLYAHHALRC